MQLELISHGRLRRVRLLEGVEDLQKHRDKLVELLERILSRRNFLHTFKIEDFITNVITGTYLVFIELDENDQLSSFAAGEFVTYTSTGTKVYRFHESAGIMGDAWQRYLPFIEEFARRHGATAIEFWARQGFFKLLKKHHYRISAVNYIKEL